MSHVTEVTGLHIYQGEEWTLEVADFNGDDAPSDLTGWSARMDFNRTDGASTPVLVRSGTEGGAEAGIVIEASPPKVIVTLTAEETRALAGGEAPLYSDFWLIEPGGRPWPYFRAQIPVSTRQTRYEVEAEP
jgi:hypothetical protein